MLPHMQNQCFRRSSPSLLLSFFPNIRDCFLQKKRELAAQLAMSLHFPLPKTRTFRFSVHTSRLSFTERSPLWRWNSQWVHTFRCQKIFRPLCSQSFKWREPRDEWSKTQDKRSNPSQSYIVRSVRSVREIGRERDTEREREREREIDRRKWRHLSGAEIGEEVCTFPCQNAEIGEEFCTFCCQKFASQLLPS